MWSRYQNCNRFTHYITYNKWDWHFEEILLNFTILTCYVLCTIFHLKMLFYFTIGKHFLRKILHEIMNELLLSYVISLLNFINTRHFAKVLNILPLEREWINFANKNSKTTVELQAFFSENANPYNKSLATKITCKTCS